MEPSTSKQQHHFPPSSVGFIANQLPNQHDAFKTSQGQYDPVSQKYVAPVSSGLTGSLPEDDLSKSRERLVPMRRPERPWDLIFTQSMQRFLDRYPIEPKARSGSGLSIRNEANWDSIYEKLQKARERYDGANKGFRGRAQRGHRKLADQNASLRQLAKFVPNDPFTSPVLAAVEVLVDVSQHPLRSYTCIQCTESSTQGFRDLI
jgi:hypothetical protein